MKKLKLIAMIALIAVAGYFTIAADHIDAPAVAGSKSDITDFYAFEGANTDNLVFAANVKGLLSPAETSTASFDENVMIEFNIDNNGDAIEDLVIQAVAVDGKMYFSGPVAPSATGTISKFEVEPNTAVDFVKITEFGNKAKIKKTSKGISLFAGPRDDPFFFDFVRFTEILTPENGISTFREEGIDTFKGTNVLSVVIEVPKSLLGDASDITAWVETKRKQ